MRILGIVIKESRNPCAWCGGDAGTYEGTKEEAEIELRFDSDECREKYYARSHERWRLGLIPKHTTK
jgi:hypothetical protein